MSFWVVLPSFTLRDEVAYFAVEVGVQALSGEKTRRTVHRRFSDFVALAERLRAELGADKRVPPLPPKQRLARVDDTFLNERRRGLEAWLWHLLGDVEVAHSTALTSFLELAAARKGLKRLTQGGASESSNATPPPAIMGAASAAIVASADAVSSPPATPAPPAATPQRSARARASPASPLAMSEDQRTAVRPLQQRYAASKADLSDALACLRSDAAVKALLSQRVDELERRVSELSAGGAPTARDEAQAANATSVQADDAERRCVSMAWELEEARSALRVSESERATAVAARDDAERRATSAQGEAAAARADAAAARNELLRITAAAEEASTRATAERKVFCKEVKALRRDLAAASATAAAASREAADAARDAVGARLAGCLREARTLRERLSEATVEHMATAEQSAGAAAADPLELLATSDARVALLTAEAQLLGRQDSAGDADAAALDAEGQVRETLSALLADNATLRKQANSLLRATLGHATAGPPAAQGRARPWWQPGNGGSRGTD